MKIKYLQFILYLIILTKKNSKFSSYLQTDNVEYSLDDIIESESRVKKIILNQQKLSNEILLSRSLESMAKFTYVMAIAILNI